MKKELVEYPYLKSAYITEYYLDDDNLWHVYHKITHSRSIDGKVWEDRNFEVRSIDKDVERAQHTVINASDRVLKKLGYSLFNEESNDKVKGISNS